MSSYRYIIVHKPSRQVIDCQSNWPIGSNLRILKSLVIEQRHKCFHFISLQCINIRLKRIFIIFRTIVSFYLPHIQPTIFAKHFAMLHTDLHSFLSLYLQFCYTGNILSKIKQISHIINFSDPLRNYPFNITDRMQLL